MPPARRLLAATALTVLWTGSAFAQSGAAPFRVVDLPDMPQSASLCAAERDALLSRVRAATAAAAENAQIAARRLAERQMALAGDTAELDRLRAERDLHAEEWRRAEAVFDAAQRIEARQCATSDRAAGKPETDEEEPPEVAETPIPSPPASRAPVAPGVGPGPAPTPPPASPSARAPSTPPPAPPASAPPPAPVPSVAQQPRQEPPPAPAAPAMAGEERPAVSLAIAVEAPSNCAANQTCAITVRIENRGARPFGSPLLASVALGFDGGTVATVTPQEWGCARAAENLTCASTGVSVAPDQSSSFVVEWRLPERLRRPSATVCARIVWAGQQPGGIYRGEQVSALQYALQRAGFETSVDGRIGPRTAEAIRQLRTRAGLSGAGITPDLLANLFGANGAISGDDITGNDSACTTVSFDGAPVAAAPAATEAAPAPPLTRRPAPRREVDQPSTRREIEPAPAPRREVERPRREVRPPVEARRRAPVEDDEEEVIIYRTPQPRYYPPAARSRGTVVYGPNGPVLVYPGPPVRSWGGGWPW